MIGNKRLFILAGNGPYENRGCEAIVRGTIAILDKHFDDCEYVVLSSFGNQEQYEMQVRNELDKRITHLRTSKYTFSKLFLPIRKLLPALWGEFVFSSMRKYLKRADAVFSVGGDNYSLDYGVPQLFIQLDNFVKRRNKPLFIWGASIGPFSKLPKFEQYMVKHLNSLNGLFVRELVSKEYLNSNGISDNVYSIADPAFCMDAVSPKNNIEIPISSIGLNLSPLMCKFITNGDKEKWIDMAVEIARIFCKTSQSIYLVSHVTVSHDDDFAFLNIIYDRLKDEYANIHLLDKAYSASEIKYIIGSFSLFAGSRTHSTIAALSMNVPTLSFAYSVKAVGLNMQIFNNVDYCIVKNQFTLDIIESKLKDMLDNKDDIKQILEEKIPSVKALSMHAGAILQKAL